MAYNIVKLENGNVGIYDSGTGDFIKAISPDYVEIECNVNGVVKLIQDNGNVEYFLPADVANTQVLPAAAVPFAGICADLAELLATDFFFELSGGGLDFEYWKGNDNHFLETQGAITSVLGTSVWGINILYAYPIMINQDINIDDLKIAFTSSVAGNSVFGLYDMQDGLPNQLLFQTTAFDNSVTGTQIYSLPSSQAIKKGIYFVAYNTSSSPNIYTFPAANVPNVFGASFTNLRASANIRLTAAYTYTGTLPATFGSPVSATNGIYVPAVLFTIS